MSTGSNQALVSKEHLPECRGNVGTCDKADFSRRASMAAVHF